LADDLNEKASSAGFDYLFKTIVIGDGSVGKTAITVRFATDKFQKNYKMTIGVDFTIKQMLVNKKRVKCQIWDTGGQERFTKIRPLYYRGALGGVIVYDVTVKQSFENLDKWFNEIQKNCDDIPIILVGNKIDLENRVISEKEGKTYAKKKSKELSREIPYLESSAKTGESIKQIFNQLVSLMVKKAEKNIQDREKAKEKTSAKKSKKEKKS
jgi:small GTP-binding protein